MFFPTRIPEEKLCFWNAKKASKASNCSANLMEYFYFPDYAQGSCFKSKPVFRIKPSPLHQNLPQVFISIKEKKL